MPGSPVETTPPRASRADAGEEDGIVPVSPRHSVRLAGEYMHLVSRAPMRDFLVRTVAKSQVGGTVLMAADIVIAGADTRERFAAARDFPLHFRKTYFPGRLHGDPAVEFAHHAAAAAILGIPPPIGHAPDQIRSCLLPGTSYARLSPFDVEPLAKKIACAEELALAYAAGLYRFTEEAYRMISMLHDRGLVHGDTELHNFIVCPSPLEMLPIDFESSMKRDGANGELWEKTRQRDLEPILREALLLQCRLGPQSGPLADRARSRIESLFGDAGAIRRAIEHSGSRPA